MALIALLQGTYADAAIAIAGKTRGVPETNRSSLQRALAWVQWAYECRLIHELHPYNEVIC